MYVLYVYVREVKEICLALRMVGTKDAIARGRLLEKENHTVLPRSQ